MESEAAPLRERLGMRGSATDLHHAFSAQLVADGSLAIATNGRDRRFEVEAIASQPAVITTLLAAERHQPDLIISAGTAGGFEARGAAIGDVYVSTAPVVFHDRRIDIPVWAGYGEGSYPVMDVAEHLGPIGAKPGVVTTGNSLDAPAVDMATMESSGATAKDMEAAAVGWVAEQLKCDFLAVKAITDFVDHPEPTGDQFQRNLATATRQLAEVTAKLLERLGR